MRTALGAIEEGMLMRDEHGITALRSGQPRSNVIMGVHKPDGALTWISICSQPLFHNGAAAPYASVVTFRDITKPPTYNVLVSAMKTLTDYWFDTVRMPYSPPAELPSKV